MTGFARAGSRTAAPPREDSGSGLWLLLLFAVFYYGFLLTAAGSIPLLGPIDYGLTFNSMLLHMLHGRFDVDPAVIGNEGYLRDGAVYAYFGIFPALLRAPLLALPGFATLDVTRLSCLLAVSLMAVFKILAARTVWTSVPSPRRPVLLSLMGAAILLSGPQIQFLRPSIFIESVLWSGALSAVFVLLVVRGWTRQEGFTIGLMSALALVAGLCLLDRVSTAVGLYLALGLIWLWRAWQATRSLKQRPSLRRFLLLSPPILVLLGFAAVAAFINQQRWGNPLVFVDLSRALMAAEFPDRLARVQQYGEFNLNRLGFGLVYYLFPIWVLRDGSGQLLWSEFVQRMLDAAELPPSSFLASDPLLVGLAVYGMAGLMRRDAVPRRIPVLLAAAGLTVPIALMLIAIVMTFRYRMEFYPLLELCGFVGFWRLAAGRPSRRFGMLVGAGVGLSIVAAHAVWFLSALSPFGPVGMFLKGISIFQFYGSLMH